MKEEKNEIFNKWASWYTHDEDFAEQTRGFIYEVELRKQSINQETQQRERCWTDDRRDCFEADADQFKVSMLSYMSPQQSECIKRALMNVYDNDDSGKWFTPRSSKEDYNIENYCRALYYLYCNQFFLKTMFNGKPLNIDGIVNIILGKDPTGADLTGQAQAPASKIKGLKFATLKAYFCKDTLHKPFENYCSQLHPQNFISDSVK